MKLLLFSGNSLRNRDWIHQVEAEVADLFDGTYVQEYAHWQNGKEWIDFGHELEVLRELMTATDGPYGVFAKSIGSVLAVQAIELGVIKPSFVLFCGLPLGYITPNYPQFDSVLAQADVPTVVIHNQFDTVGTGEAANTYLYSALGGKANYEFIMTPGDSHDYDDYPLIREELTRLKAGTI